MPVFDKVTNFVDSFKTNKARLADLELLYNNFWDFTIQRTGTTIAEDIPSNFSILCRSINIPTITLNTIKRNSNRSNHYESVELEEDLNISFLESENLEVLRWFYEWLNSVYDYATGKFKTGPGKKRNGILTLYQPNLLGAIAGSGDAVTNLRLDGVSTSLSSIAAKFGGIIAQYRIQNILPKKATVPEFDYENPEPKIVSYSFSVEDIYEVRQ